MTYTITANNSLYFILRLIYDVPGIRYNDLARITRLNNGSISHYIRVLEKKDLIKVYKSNSNKTTRYFSPSVNMDDYSVLGFFKNQNCRQIILLLYLKNGNARFDEIKKSYKENLLNYVLVLEKAIG